MYIGYFPKPIILDVKKNIIFSLPHLHAEVAQALGHFAQLPPAILVENGPSLTRFFFSSSRAVKDLNRERFRSTEEHDFKIQQSF